MVFLKLELSLKHNKCSFTTSRHGNTRSQNTCAEPQVAVAQATTVNFTSQLSGILMFFNTDPELLPRCSFVVSRPLLASGLSTLVKTAVRRGALTAGHWARFHNCPGYYGASNGFTPDLHFSVSLTKWPRPPCLRFVNKSGKTVVTLIVKELIVGCSCNQVHRWSLLSHVCSSTALDVYKDVRISISSTMTCCSDLGKLEETQRAVVPGIQPRTF